jgi:hypothetical protein
VQASLWLGHSAQEHLRTYAHAVLDRTEVDYGAIAAARDRSRGVELPTARPRS